MLVTAIAWLYAPFLLSQRPMALQQFWVDVIHWREFFVADSGAFWLDWYKSSRLQSKGDLGMVSVSSLCWLAVASLWYGTLCEAWGPISSSSVREHAACSAWLLVFLPPIVVPTCFCSVAAARRCSSQTAELVLPALAALCLVALSVAEAVMALWMLVGFGGCCRSFIAGLLLKASLLGMILAAVEHYFRRLGPHCEVPARRCMCSRVAWLWLASHRMSADLLVSSLVLWPTVLLPLVTCSFGGREEEPARWSIPRCEENGGSPLLCRASSNPDLLAFADPSPVHGSRRRWSHGGGSYTDLGSEWDTSLEQRRVCG